ncbi:hypothetical protein [Mesorhizobium sp.]|uniref:hypothetical protein n=1 Tax=Mesorhizobium sp. TaxID=1871066 RepID=UPI000FE53AA3|nr:hypothetical protein [Mesorhizobium sp.]RWO08239.1 MAG: hypothetical protein EOS15_29945 [Mesorhizobium sp.]
MVDLAATVWRDFVTDGVPSSGTNKTRKHDVRQWGAYLESLANLSFTNGKVYATKAAMDADLVPAANTSAIVSGNGANDGLYMKVGATGVGSWTRLLDFVPGTQIVHAVDAGAGTPNAIIATSAVSLSTSGAQIVRLDVFETNTASPVTVAFNGGSALTIKTAAGNDVVVGGLTAGPLLGMVSGSTFRLLSDQASAAVLSGAETAAATSVSSAAAALAAANAGFVFDSQSDAQAATIPGVLDFVRTAGYASAGGGGEALYKKVGSEPSHAGKFQSADGAWWEIAEAIPTLAQFGGDKAGSVEATALITSMLSAFDTIKIPAGTWKVEAITLTAGKTLLTDGLKTIIQQKSGVAIGTRIINITGSNVTVGSFKAIGNIATDTDEQNFVVYVRGAADISNIVIGDIIAENIRGDAVYIGGLTTAKVTNLSIGNITGNNVLRNVVSITGGEQISIGAISGNACGYFMFDVEPNANSQKCDLIDVQSIRGHCVGVVGLRAQKDKRIGRVRVGMLDLDPTLTADSTPAYGHRATLIVDAIALRNVEHVQVGMLKARNFGRSAARVTFNHGEYGCGVLDVGIVDIEDCITTDVTSLSAFIVGNVHTFIIRGGHVRLTTASHRLLLSNTTGISSTDRINPFVDVTVTCNGTLGWGVFGGVYRSCKVHPAAGRICHTIRLASTANVDISTLNNGDTIDGVAVATGDIVLLKDQTAGAENGFYSIGAAAPAVRWNPGGNGSEDFVDVYAFVRLGTANAEKFFSCTNATDPVLGTTSITFAEAAPHDAYLFNNSRDVVIIGSNFVLGRAGNDCTNFSIIGTNWKTTHASIVWNQSTLADGSRHNYVGSVLNGVTYVASNDIEATATVDPASLMPGQRTATATIAVAGAALGNIAKASFSLNLAPVRIIAWVSAANTVSYYFENPQALLTGSATYDAASIAAGAEVTTTVTVTGAAIGDVVVGTSHGVDQAGLTIEGYVSAANTVTAVVRNGTGGAVDLASATLRAVVLPVAATDIASGTLKIRVEK